MSSFDGAMDVKANVKNDGSKAFETILVEIKR